MRILPPVRRDSISTAVTTRRLHKRLSTPAIGSGEIDENGTAVTFGPQVGLRNRHRVLPIASAMLTDAQMLEFAIAVARVFELAGIGAIIAVRVSDEPHATWTGPSTVMVSTLTTLILMGMSQPIWSLLVTALLVFAIGWSVGRSHVGLPFLPEELTGRFGSGAEG